MFRGIRFLLRYFGSPEEEEDGEDSEDDVDDILVDVGQDVSRLGLALAVKLLAACSSERLQDELRRVTGAAVDSTFETK